MVSQAGLLLAGGSGGGSGGDLHGSQAAAAAAALQVGSQPLPEHGTAGGQQLFAGTGTDNGEPAYLTLEVHSALARCVHCLPFVLSLRGCARGWRRICCMQQLCPLNEWSNLRRWEAAAPYAGPCRHAPHTPLQNVLRFRPRTCCRSNRPPLGSAVSPQTTVGKSRSRSTTSPQKLEQLAAGFSPSPPSPGKGTQASKVSAAAGQLGQQQQPEGMPGEQQAEEQEARTVNDGVAPTCSVQQACGAPAAPAAAGEEGGDVEPAPAADELAGCDLPATQLVLPGTLPATARATQLPGTAQVTQLPATAPVRASLAGTADLPLTAAATGAQPPASQFPLLATQEVGLPDEEDVQQQAQQQQAQQAAEQEQQQEQGATQLAAAVAAAAVAQALAAAPADSPAADEAANTADQAAAAMEVEQQAEAEPEPPEPPAVEPAVPEAAGAVEPAAHKAAGAVEAVMEPAVPAPVPLSVAGEAPASFIPLPSALDATAGEAAMATASGTPPEEAAAAGGDDADMPDAAEPADHGAEPMEVEEAAVENAAAAAPQLAAATAGPVQAEQLVAAEPAPSQPAARDAAAPAATLAAAAVPGGSQDSGRSSSLYSYSSDEEGEEDSQDGGERVPPSPICTAEQVSCLAVMLGLGIGSCLVPPAAAVPCFSGSLIPCLAP